MIMGNFFDRVWFKILVAIMKLVILEANLDKLVALDVMIMGIFLDSLQLRISVDSSDQEVGDS